MGQNNTWNPAQLNQRINELEAKVKAADVEANPTGEATEALEKVSIDGDIYSIPEAVAANPTGEIVNDISGIQIGSSKFNIKEKSDYIEVVADGTKSISALMDDLFALVDFDKIRNTSSFRLDKSYYPIYTVDNTSISFVNSDVTTTIFTIRTFTLKSSGSTYYFTGRSNDGTVAVPTNSSSLILNSGVKLSIYY